MTGELPAKEVNSVFEQPWWLDVVAPGRWHELVVSGKNGECLGRMLYTEQSLCGVSYIGMPFLTQQMGPWLALSPDMKTVKRLHKTKAVLEELISQLDGKKNIDLAFHHSFQYILPFVWRGYQVIPAVSYVIEDLRNLDSVYGDFETNLRNLIKNAQKKYVLNENICCEELSLLLEMTFAKQKRKLPFDRQLLERIYEESQKHQSGKALGARDRETGKLVAAAFFLYDEHTCYYLLGGKDYSLKADGSQELLLWEGIQFASAISREFDFEGSMIPGIESFFRGFGGRPRIYFRVRKGGTMFSLLHWAKPQIKNLLGYK